MIMAGRQSPVAWLQSKYSAQSKIDFNHGIFAVGCLLQCGLVADMHYAS